MVEVINIFDKAKLNQDFAEKLRNEHPLQLVTLIKMHLSFLLDLNCLNEETENEVTDKTKNKKNWLFPTKKKTTVCTSSSSTKSPETPIFVPEMMKQIMILINFLEKDENIKQEGIFRKTGSITRQQDLKFIVNQMKPLKLDDDSEYTAHDVASVLKSILSDLPEPILCEIYFPAYSQIADICNSKENDEKDRIKTSLQLLFLLLPSENRTILELLIRLLHKASTMETYNKMNSDSLATLFTPHLICPRKLSPEVLHQTAATMTRMISFMITHGISIFHVPEKLATDIKAYFVEEKRRKETPEKILDESISDSVANTVFTFVDRQKTAEAHGDTKSTTDTALAQLYAHIQSLPESSKKKKLIKQFNKQNGQGTPLQFVNRDKPQSACRSIGDSIKKHIFHKTLHKTPKRSSTNSPSLSSSSKITRTPLIQTQPNKRILFQSPLVTNKLSPPLNDKSSTSTSSISLTFVTATITSNEANASTNNCSTDNDLKIDDKPAIPIIDNHAEMSHEEMIDDEDFVDSTDDEDDHEEGEDTNEILKQQKMYRNVFLPIDEMEHKTLISLASETKKSTSNFKSRLMKGVSLGSLFPFGSSSTTPRASPKMKKSKSSSILIDIEKDDEKRKLLMKSVSESFDSSEESDMFFSMDHTKEGWHVDVSNINYFLNQTGMPEQQHVGVRNSMSPITKSTQRMPKSMQESIMTPRSRKPVMIPIFAANTSDPKSYRANISQLLEESEEIPNEANDSQSTTKDAVSQSSSGISIPINLLALGSQDSDETLLNAVNDNGLPTIMPSTVTIGNSSGSLTSAFNRDYLQSRGQQAIDENDQPDDYSFSSQSDDFESSSEYQKLEESRDTKENDTTSPDMEIDKIINQSSMSKSLLHCLDGNEVSLLSSPLQQTSSSTSSTSRKRFLNDDNSNESPSKRPLITPEDLTDF